MNPLRTTLPPGHLCPSRKHHSIILQNLATRCSGPVTTNLGDSGVGWIRTAQWLVLLSLLVSFLPRAQAQDFSYFTEADNTIMITGYSGPGGDVTLPSSIDGLPVASIGAQAFSGKTSLTSVTIPNGISSIGTGSFAGCANLISITIPGSVASIGNAAFSNCGSLECITIPEGVSSIGLQTFYQCGSLASVSLPASLRSIGDSAFARCTSLAGIVIPEGVTAIGFETFYNCNSLTNITIPDSITIIGDVAFTLCSSLTRIVIPDNVATIGAGAFSNCTGLTNVTIGSSVTGFGDNAFYNNTSLTSVYFKGNAPALGSDVFGAVSNATVYYLPDTTGWLATYGELPTAPWVLPELISIGVPVVTSGQFGFTLLGSGGQSIVVEACTNLTNHEWTVVETITLTDGEAIFTDPDPATLTGRFYRLRMP